MAGITIIQPNINEKGLFALSGAIDDLADFNPILRTDTHNVILDFEKIQEVNSYGVKIWSQFLNSLKNKQVIYRNCHPPIINQMNIVLNLRRNVTVESFYLPFECTSCLIEKEVLVKHDRSIGNDIETFLNAKVRNVNCSRCAGLMDFMEDEDYYFRFLGFNMV